jgi:hypothetical protein
MNATYYTTIVAKAFSGEGRKKNRVRVDPNGEVRVYDSVGDIYTLCHILSPRTIARLHAAAKRCAAQ